MKHIASAAGGIIVNTRMVFKSKQENIGTEIKALSKFFWKFE